jgi:hypothetical protein
MKGGYVCLIFQQINVKKIDSNQLNKFWMSYSNINQKGMQDYFDIPKWHTFIWNANTLLKIQTMSFFYTNVSYISFQTFGM